MWLPIRGHSTEIIFLEAVPSLRREGSNLRSAQQALSLWKLLVSNNISQPARLLSFLFPFFPSALPPSSPPSPPLLPSSRSGISICHIHVERERSKEHKRKRGICICTYPCIYLLKPLNVLDVWYRNISQGRECEGTWFSSLQSLCTVSFQKAFFREYTANQKKRWEVASECLNPINTLYSYEQKVVISFVCNGMMYLSRLSIFYFSLFNNYFLWRMTIKGWSKEHCFKTMCLRFLLEIFWDRNIKVYCELW